MAKAFIGIDIGGGSVKLGVVNAQGRVLNRATFLTPSGESRSHLLDVLCAHIDELSRQSRRAGHRVAGIGVGAPGPIDVDRGFVYFFPNIPGWKDTALAAILKRRTKLPVRVDNDANAMAYGEYRFGAGRGARHMLALTLGTGIGGGIIIDGKLFHGPAFSAAEIGHVIVDEKGERCACGNRGCIETFVGTGYFTRRMKRRTGRALAPVDAAKAARSGDAKARALWTETGERLGTFLAGYCNVLNPERIVLGGGISQSGELLFAPLRKSLSKKAFPIAARSVKVVPARLGVDAGLVGAAALAMPTEPRK